eukprot:TRINITY_DN1388_c0_g1_i1.p1 TRINITY_DN1388_c0_g1~~TRINITY_DN1388_c0_g1_i1.p1  ORF type:complete len:111 (+),score=48.28 TRINITY_DN1388_c0_g1_i1:87-419(+)
MFSKRIAALLATLFVLGCVADKVDNEISKAGMKEMDTPPEKAGADMDAMSKEMDDDIKDNSDSALDLLNDLEAEEDEAGDDAAEDHEAGLAQDEDHEDEQDDEDDDEDDA